MIRALAVYLFAFWLTPSGSFAAAAITDVMGITVTTASTILGHTPNSGIMGTALVASGGSPNTYAFVQTVSTLNGDAGSTTVASPSITVTAGNLVVAWVKWETATTVSSVSDGTTTFSAGTLKAHANTDLNGQFFYLLSGNSGAKTITVTFSASTPFRRIIVSEFSHTVSAVFDTQNTGSGAGATGPVVIASGSVTTAAQGLVLGGYSEYGAAVMNTPRVATNAATGKPNSTSSGLPWMWYYITSGIVLGAADCNMSTGSNESWIVNAIAFK